MHKTKIAIAVTTAFLLGAANASYAADPATKQPLDQAIKSVDKNLVKDPDNKGLQNAAERLQTNQERQEKKRAEQEAKRQAKIDKRAGKMSDRHDAGHAEKMGRPGKMERPNR